MSDADRGPTSDAGIDDVPPAIGDAVRALREPVPIRDEWRAALLREIAAEPAPSMPSHAAAAMPSAWTHARRTWAVRPAAGIAALVLATVLGAAGATMYLGRGDPAATARADMPPSPVRTTDAIEPRAGLAQPAHGPASVVRFAIVAEGATRVAVVGDFNRWDPTATPLRRGTDGRTWTVAVPLPTGRHVYAFVVDGGLTADPTAPRAAGDDFGEPSSVVVVSEAST